MMIPSIVRDLHEEIRFPNCTRKVSCFKYQSLYQLDACSFFSSIGICQNFHIPFFIENISVTNTWERGMILFPKPLSIYFLLFSLFSIPSSRKESCTAKKCKIMQSSKLCWHFLVKGVRIYCPLPRRERSEVSGSRGSFLSLSLLLLLPSRLLKPDKKGHLNTQNSWWIIFFMNIFATIRWRLWGVGNNFLSRSQESLIQQFCFFIGFVEVVEKFSSSYFLGFVVPSFSLFLTIFLSPRLLPCNTRDLVP